MREPPPSSGWRRRVMTTGSAASVRTVLFPPQPSKPPLRTLRRVPSRPRTPVAPLMPAAMKRPSGLKRRWASERSNPRVDLSQAAGRSKDARTRAVVAVERGAVDEDELRPVRRPVEGLVVDRRQGATQRATDRDG